MMILTQLEIAPVIVTVTDIALIGAPALTAALAIGVSGREVAAELVNSGDRKGPGPDRAGPAGQGHPQGPRAAGAQQYTAAHDQSGGGNRYGHDGQVGRPAGSTRQ
jgi:hypothetical protein